MRASWRTAALLVWVTAACASTSNVERTGSTGAVVVSQGPCTAPHCEQTAPAQDAGTFTSATLGVELDKPAGDGWALATDVISPQGNEIPVVVAHPASGAQIVMQVSEAMDSPKSLATMLRSKLHEEGSLELGEPEQLKLDHGGDAYGFDFSVDGEAKGRVALIQLGEQIVLVVASWPPDAGARVEKDIDGVVKSVRRPAGGATPTLLRPDKA